MALASKALILSLSWLTRDFRYSSSSEGAIIAKETSEWTRLTMAKRKRYLAFG